jgi:hypothetical protein
MLAGIIFQLRRCRVLVPCVSFALTIATLVSCYLCFRALLH